MPGADEKGFSTAMYVGAQTNSTDLLQNQTRRQWKIETIEKGPHATMRIWDASSKIGWSECWLTR